MCTCLQCTSFCCMFQATLSNVGAETAVWEFCFVHVDRKESVECTSAASPSVVLYLCSLFRLSMPRFVYTGVCLNFAPLIVCVFFGITSGRGVVEMHSYVLLLSTLCCCWWVCAWLCATKGCWFHAFEMLQLHPSDVVHTHQCFHQTHISGFVWPLRSRRQRANHKYLFIPQLHFYALLLNDVSQLPLVPTSLLLLLINIRQICPRCSWFRLFYCDIRLSCGRTTTKWLMVWVHSNMWCSLSFTTACYSGLARPCDDNGEKSGPFPAFVCFPRDVVPDEKTQLSVCGLWLLH